MREVQTHLEWVLPIADHYQWVDYPNQKDSSKEISASDCTIDKGVLKDIGRLFHPGTEDNITCSAARRTLVVMPQILAVT